MSRSRPPKLRAPRLTAPPPRVAHRTTISGHILEPPQSTMLDLVDHLLNKGVVAVGDVTLGVAGIDLIYLRLSALLCAADRILPHDPQAPPRRSRHRQPGARKKPA
jgi:hypothetical protein